MYVFELEIERTETNEKSNDGNATDVRIKTLYEKSFFWLSKSLLAMTTGPGYFLVDERNQTRTIKQIEFGAKAGSSNAISPARGMLRTKPEAEEVTRSLNSMFRPTGSGQDQSAVASSVVGDGQRLLTSAQDHEERVAEGDLESVLRFTTSAVAPSPAELFKRVVGVLAKSMAG